jgi:hypothetical protein
MKNIYEIPMLQLLPKMEKTIVLLILFIILASACFSQPIINKYFSGKPKFINTSVGKVMAVDYLSKPNDDSDSVKMNSIAGLVYLSNLVNKSISDTTGVYNDYRFLDATKIGIIAYYRLDYTLFYCEVGDAGALFNNKISNAEFVKRIQLLTLSDYKIETPVPEKKTFMTLIKMDHPYYSFPMRLSILIPFGAPYGLTRNMGFELSNVWSRPKSVANFKFQISCIWLEHKETPYYARYIIPSYNMGLELNFLGDIRFNIKPYLTLGWDPVYYYFKGENSTTPDPRNLTNGWYLTTGAINYGLDIDAWIKKGLGVSITLEQSRFFSEILPDIYGSAKTVAIDYFTFKVGLIF